MISSLAFLSRQNCITHSLISQSFVSIFSPRVCALVSTSGQTAPMSAVAEEREEDEEEEGDGDDEDQEGQEEEEEEEEDDNDDDDEERDGEVEDRLRRGSPPPQPLRPPPISVTRLVRVEPAASHAIRAEAKKESKEPLKEPSTDGEIFIICFEC